METSAFNKKYIALILLAVLFVIGISHGNLQKLTVYAANPKIVVIDPGHGGTNKGTDCLPIPEKNYNMIVALYMKEYLETFQNVRVYLTHEQDCDMSLEERADFAKSVNADLLVSLHFNASLNHALYGSEVWIPSEGQLYCEGYSAANEFMSEFEEMGLFNRGIKTRVGNTGLDYYGIIRYSSNYNIPAIIVEHCHFDNANDLTFIQSNEKLKDFGIRDARAVAKYFSLKSKDGMTDYSDYAPLAVPVPDSRVYNDATPPSYVGATLVKYDKTGKYLTAELTAFDNESGINYYSYSIDNGQTWAPYQTWTKGMGTMTVSIKLGYGKKPPIIFKAVNEYDLETVSNTIKFNLF